MRNCEENFLLALKSDEFDINLVCGFLSEIINSFSISTNEMIEEIENNLVAKMHMDQISWYWIRTAAEAFINKGNYDDRNKASYWNCYRLFHSESGEKSIPDFTKEYNLMDFDFSVKTLEERRVSDYLVSVYMRHEHRTLQQTFTGFVFTYLTRTNQLFQEITKEIGEDRMGYMWMI